MKLLLLYFLFYLYNCLAADVIIHDQKELIKFLQEFSHDIRILEANMALKASKLNEYKSSFHPILGLGANYLDDQTKPFITFQPQRTENIQYQTSVSQRFMIGTAISLGFSNDQTKIFGIRQADNGLSFNRFNQPRVFLELSFDLSKNLFGRMDRNNLSVLELESINEVYNLSSGTQHIYYSGILYLWNIRMTQEVVEDVIEYLDRLKTLQRDISIRIDRKTSEPGDLYNLKATIATKTAEILALNRSMQNVNSEMQKLLSYSGNIYFKPNKSLGSISQKINDAENEILSLEKYQSDWSSVNKVSNNNVIVAEKKYRNARLDTLPDIKLFARYARSGTSSNAGDSYSELYRGINPQYAVGVDFTWPLSATGYKSKRAIGKSHYDIANLNDNKITRELKVQFENLKNEIRDLRYESQQVDIALENSIKLLEDLHKRYQQGRISLFELVIEEGKLLEIRVQNKRTWVTRINTLIKFYSVFDLYEYDKKFI